MDVTIGICTYNRCARLRQTLEHMTRLQVPAGVRWEIVVVNNNSRDETVQVIDEFSASLPIRAALETKQGLSAARNRAIREARGEFFLCTDDDIVPNEDWVATTLRAFDTHDADIVYGRLVPVWDTAPPSWYGPRFAGRFGVLDLGDEPFVASEGGHSFFGANHAARRAQLIALGGYCEELGLVGNVGGAEDNELFCRAMDAGWKVVYEPASVVGHMIEAERCEKRYHRSRTLRGCECYRRSLDIEAKDSPRMFGVPRYVYRVALGDLAGYAASLACFDRSAAFFHELKLIQFAGLLREAARARGAPASETKGRPAEAAAEEVDEEVAV